MSHSLFFPPKFSHILPQETNLSSNLNASITEAMEVIEENKLDDLEPYEELSLPKEPPLTFIDEVIAGATRTESQVGIFHSCIIQ